MSAEFGRTAGGIISLVSKSGTNVFHGNLFEFLRNDNLNANDFFANRAGRRVAPLAYNQFGGTLGGPVKKNQIFFFEASSGETFCAQCGEYGFPPGLVARKRCLPAWWI